MMAGEAEKKLIVSQLVPLEFPGPQVLKWFDETCKEYKEDTFKKLILSLLFYHY